jgi:hypothetical protein
MGTYLVSIVQTVAATTIQVDAVEKQVLTVTPVADANAEHLIYLRTASHITLAAIGVVAGDWVRVLVQLEFDDWAGWDADFPALYNEVYTSGGSAALVWQANVNGTRQRGGVPRSWKPRCCFRPISGRRSCAGRPAPSRSATRPTPRSARGR